jgi:glycosyltransferase 2 family protein
MLRNRKLWVSLGLIAGTIIAFRLFLNHFNWVLFFSSLSDLRPGWLGVSVVLSLLTYLIRVGRWKVLLAPVKEIPLARLFWATIVGFSAIYLLGRVAELGRPLWLMRQEKVPLSASIATVVVERFLDAIMLVAVFAWAMMVIEVPEDSVVLLAELKRAAWLIAGTALVALMFLFVLRSHVNWVSRLIRHIRFPTISRLTETFAQGLGFLGKTTSLAAVMIHSVALWILMALQSWSMFLGTNLEFSFGAATLVMVAAAIGSIVQVPGIGGGFQIAWAFCLVELFGVGREQAVASALIAFLFSYGPTIVVGGLYVLAQGISMSDFKTASHA